jgi:hypothetical protein
VRPVIRADDWLSADNPDVLLYALLPEQPRAPNQVPATVRRVQLFVCACARAVWDLLPTDARSAVAVREKFADGVATGADVRAAGVRFDWNARTAADMARNAVNDNPHDAARWAAKARGSRAAGDAPPSYEPARLRKWHAQWTAAFVAARAKQAEFVRDIFPPPGYAPALRAEWVTDTVRAIARQMDETGDFGAVPILADALQDAGCDDETALARCRAASGVHCRGNWVVDSVLGRA